MIIYDLIFQLFPNESSKIGHHFKKQMCSEPVNNKLSISSESKSKKRSLIPALLKTAFLINTKISVYLILNQGVLCEILTLIV